MTIRKSAQTIFPSLARTATSVSPVLQADTCKAATLIINVTAATATPSVVFKIEGKDPVSEAFWTILETGAITATGINQYRMGHSIVSNANVAANAIIPEEFRVTATHADSDSITYSMSIIGMEEI